MSILSSEREALVAALLREERKASAYAVLLSNAAAERLGLTLTDLECIELLSMTGPITAGQLAELAGLTTGAITGVLDRLEKAGHVRRERDPDDRRRVFVHLALDEAGARAIRAPYAPLDRALADLLAGYSDAELAVLADFAARSTGATQEALAQLRSASPESADGARSVPLGASTRARLVLASGIAQSTLRADPDLGDLLRARFEGREWPIQVRGDTIILKPRRSFFDWSSGAAEIALNTSVPWEIQVRGGAASVTADLRWLRLAALEIDGGASEVTITLPPPAGAVPVRITGGASQVTLRRPAGVALRAQLRGWGIQLSLDSQQFDVAGEQTRWETPGFAGAADYYDVEIRGGFSHVTLDTA
jgi:DNA-binding MarR family transcriptional regulator